MFFPTIGKHKSKSLETGKHYTITEISYIIPTFPLMCFFIKMGGHLSPVE
jgi:hypothetical protein